MNLQDTVSALAALAQESRLELFRLLVKRGPDGYSPSDLTNKLSIPGPTLSFHLKALLQAGLITARKDGRFIYYSPDFDCVNKLLGFLTDHCCSLSTSQCDSGCLPATNTARQKPKPPRAASARTP